MKYNTISDSSMAESHILLSSVVRVAVPTGNTTGLQFHCTEQIGKIYYP